MVFLLKKIKLFSTLLLKDVQQGVFFSSPFKFPDTHLPQISTYFTVHSIFDIVRHSRSYVRKSIDNARSDFATQAQTAARSRKSSVITTIGQLR